MRKKPISSAKPAIDRMMARLQDAKTLRYSWNEAYWREAARLPRRNSSLDSTAFRAAGAIGNRTRTN